MTRADRGTEAGSASDDAGGRGSGARVLSISLSVVCLLLAVGHVLWPDVRIDAITLGLLALAVAPWLGRIFQSIEMPGGWKFTYRELERRVQEELSRSQEQVDHLAGRVDRVESFVFSGDVTPQRTAALARALTGFREYLDGLGCHTDRPLPRIHIGPDPIDGEPIDGMLAYYDGRRNVVVVGADLVSDHDVSLHEYCHYLLRSIAPEAGLDGAHAFPTDAPAAARDAEAAEAGLADYLPCSFLDDPCMGRNAARRNQREGGCLRRVDVDVAVDDLRDGVTPHEAGAVWAGAFWALRAFVGVELLDAALIGAWKEWDATEAAEVRVAAFVDRLIGGLTSVDERAVRTVFERRGLIPAT